MRIVPALLAVLFLIPARGAETPESIARAVARDLAEGRHAAVVERFVPEMARALPESRLREVWLSLTAQMGPLKRTGAPRVSPIGGISVVTVPMHFENAALDMKVSVAPDGRLSGLRFVPAEEPPAPWSAPPYADPSRFREEEVSIGQAPFTLPGMLSLPAAARGKAPAVVLVHGSGPHDRNETIGPNRPFQDLAWGLASRGVAVLRYDKRTKAHPEKAAALKNLTVREEVMDDARAAVAFLRSRPEIDAARIVLVGHSLGGTLAPRIAREERGIAGLVVLAGATRPLGDLILEQTAYIASLGRAPEEETKKRLEALRADVEKARAARPGDPPVLNAPGSYWADLNSYDPGAAAAALKIPMLFLQGGRDYQVTSKDLEGWKRALKGRSGVTFQELPDLDHLFVAGVGKGTPYEYEKAGHVDARVVDAVAGFVGGIRRP